MVSGVPIFQVKKLRLREVRSLAPNHTDKKQWGWDLNVGKLASEVACFISVILSPWDYIHTCPWRQRSLLRGHDGWEES